MTGINLGVFMLLTVLFTSEVTPAKKSSSTMLLFWEWAEVIQDTRNQVNVIFNDTYAHTHTNTHTHTHKRRMCVFDVCIVDKDAASYDGRHPHKILSQHKCRKKGKYIYDCLDRQFHFMPLVLSMGGVMEEETTSENKQLASALLKNGQGILGKMRVCLGLSLSEPGAGLQLAGAWGHGASIPGNKYECQRMELKHQDWICGKFRDLDRERRRHIWRGWALLLGYGDGEVGMGDLS